MKSLIVRRSSYLKFLPLIACLPLVCGYAAAVQARSLAEILQSGEIRFCVSPFPPQDTVEPADCRENCKFGGYSYDLAMAFVEALGKGLKPKFMRVEWDEQFFNKEGKVVREDAYTPELLASGKCDLFPGLTKVGWRLNKFDFVTLNPSRMVVVVNKASKAQFTKPADLGGKLASTMKDSSWQTWLEEQNKTVYAANPIRIKLVPAQDVLKAVDIGQADFALSDSELAMWFINNDLKNSVTAFAVGSKTEIAWAFRKYDKDLQAAVQKFFDAQRPVKDSALNKIWIKNYGMTVNEFIETVNQMK